MQADGEPGSTEPGALRHEPAVFFYAKRYLEVMHYLQGALRHEPVVFFQGSADEGKLRPIRSGHTIRLSEQAIKTR